MQNDSIEIVVNGERKSVPADLSVSELLNALEVAADRVAVELNKSIVRKRDWGKTPVPNGSQIEIVQFVGGG
ncbi:MAG TPA: sulfur carrier protein ThiS [Bryobacteraceae bacterium]|nr:sulfur carrier protein ThiS [Bryobacteraceae bacterium]